MKSSLTRIWLGILCVWGRKAVRADMVTSRRSFMCKLMGLIPGILLASPKELRAAKQETRDLLGQLEMEILRTSRPKRNPSMICRASEKAATLYLKGNGEEIPICMMNPTGYMIWKACDGNRSPKQISKLIFERYRVSEHKTQLDTLLFLALLKKAEAIALPNHGV
jgi:hypothetical protein